MKQLFSARKAFVTSIALVLMMIPNLISAEENNAKENETITHPVTGETITAAYTLDENGDLVEMDLDKAREKLQTSKEKQNNDSSQKKVSTSLQPDEGIVEPNAVGIVTEYTETDSYVVTGGAEKVSPTVDCIDEAGDCGIDVAFNETVTDSYSAGISTDIEMSKVTAGASFSWTHSTSTSESIILQQEVPSGEVGWVTFYPYYNKTEGDLKTYDYDTGLVYSDEFVTAESPKMVNGYADGIYTITLD